MLARQMRRAQAVEIALYVALAAWARNRGWSAPAAAALVPALVLGTRLAGVAAMHAVSWVHRAPRSADERIGLAGGLVAFVREYLAFLAMALVYLPWERRVLRPDPPDDAPGAMPVVLVHGYFVNRGCWTAFVHALEARGVSPVYVPNCRSHMASIERFEEDLHAAIERISQRGARQVALVAHSMGGLAARLYLAKRGSSRVARLVTIGSPHRGTWLAAWGLGPNARQMRPGSDFLRGLDAREASCAHPGTLSIYSMHDDMIAPQDASRLAWARNVALRGYGHISLFRAPEVLQIVLDELRRDG
jgi:triacylglycerol lipase